jgi:hypothetical protein
VNISQLKLRKFDDDNDDDDDDDDDNNNNNNNNNRARGGRTMALGSIAPLTEMSTRYISWRVKAAGA